MALRSAGLFTDAPITPEQIDTAYAAISPHLVRTPIKRSLSLSDQCGADVYLKLENLQATGSFKERGALNKLLRLSSAERARGVIAASAGNHAQGLAYHARRLGVRATIVMPTTTPLVKVQQTESHGATVILEGNGYDDAFTAAQKIARKEGQVFVHAFADPDVIAGQGTIGVELLAEEALREVDVVLVPIGGGGLIAGVATYLKAHRPQITVIGVQASVCPGMTDALDAGHPVIRQCASSLADGIAVKQVDLLNFNIVRNTVDSIIAVHEDEIAQAVFYLLEKEKITVEGAGAVGVAAILAGKIDCREKRIVCLITGGNIDVSVLNRIIMKGLAQNGRIMEATIRIKDIPGTLHGVLGRLRELQANILHVTHHRFGSLAPYGFIDVALTLETKGHQHRNDIECELYRLGCLL